MTPRSRPRLARRRRSLLGVLTAIALLGLPGLAAMAAASTSPGPSLPPCAVGASTLEAGTPLALSGTRSTDEPVGVMVRRADGEFREPAVVTINQTWRAVLLFGVADGGPWTVEVVVDGVSCTSPLTVTLPAGVVAPPILPLASESPQDPSATGIDSSALWTAAVIAAVVVVVGSWLLLVLLALARGFGARPLARRPVRGIARVAIFVSVLGAGIAIWAVVYFMDGMLHFDPGIPSDQRAVLDGALWVVVVFGSVLGMLGARRLGAGPAPGEARS
jgi:hypothetical protein